MSNTVIKVENLGKQYRLGDIGTGTISHDLNRWWARVRGKEDPFLKLGEVNDRTQKGISDFVWALKDVSFDLNQGDVLGIIGKNGAGKSTLLKILSRTTSPTTGSYKVKGRIASLLEVGTGFHPELSGRENIFLNGAILGMTKSEIKSKFDEIVDFSGVERYIDTPVKRYSSGMYVRLAFGVAAHLESEILIVDEVLAVGDQEFQDKCIGKMKNVSSNGRTVIFVSHNMGAVKQLCTSAMLMHNGSITASGSTQNIINTYFSNDDKLLNDGIVPRDFKRAYNSGQGYIDKVITKNNTHHIKSNFFFKEQLSVKLEFELLIDIPDLIISFSVSNDEMHKISYYEYPESSVTSLNLKKGMHSIDFVFSDSFLPGKYFLTPHLFKYNGDTIDYIERVGLFEVQSDSLDGMHNYKWHEKHGNSFMKLENINIL